MNCKKCKNEVEKYDNSFHKLCMKCNRVRLESAKSPKIYKYTKDSNKFNRGIVERIHRPVKGNKSNRIIYSGGNGSKSLGNKILDEIFYEKCFNGCKVHECEECGDPLPTEFRGDDNKILYRARYSHIIAKSIAPELRHSLININHLCMSCHQSWEFGTREDMKIYKSNKLRLSDYFR